MPVEVPQSNGHVAEVRFICDKCGRLIGTRFMLETQVEEKKSARTVCQQCKEGTHFQSKILHVDDDQTFTDVAK